MTHIVRRIKGIETKMLMRMAKKEEEEEKEI
jgi:hypothetical protein